MPFTFTPVEPGITRCWHQGPITLEDSRQLRAFLRQDHGKLLVNLYDTPIDQSAREYLRVRSMLPETAFFGPPLPRLAWGDLPGKHIYLHQARHFATEAEALAWLRRDAPVSGEYDPAEMEDAAR